MPLQVLIDLATEKDYLTKFNLGDTGNLTHAFFCHPNGAKLALKFQSVLILDCTYKTNRYKMPLLHFVGCTAFNSTFTIGYAFLSKEEIVAALKRIISETGATSMKEVGKVMPVAMKEWVYMVYSVPTLSLLSEYRWRSGRRTVGRANSTHTASDKLAEVLSW